MSRRAWTARFAVAAGVLGVLAVGLLLGRSGEAGQVVPSADAQVATSLPLVAAPVTTFDSVLDASGYVVAARRATVSSATTGRLIEVLVKEGDMVRAGQVLARLDPRDINQQIRLAQAQLEVTRHMVAQRQAELEAAGDRLRRMRGLVAQQYVGEGAYKAAVYEERRMRAARDTAAGEVGVAKRQLAVQQQRLKNLDIVAPFDGMVTERSAQVGEIVSPISAGGGFTRTGICTLVDMASIEVRVRVNEKHVGRVHPGQLVALVPRAYPDVRLRGRVTTIMPVAERATASVEVIVDFVDRDSRILPNMSIDVAFGANDAPRSGGRPVASAEVSSR